MALKINSSTRLPDIKMERVFHPVGQGAFYTEVFRDYLDSQIVMVYDCGTETSNQSFKNNKGVLLKQQIEEFADSLDDNSRKIDYLFISHLHHDHISGLGDLMKTLLPQRIYLPMLPIEVILLYRINNLVRYRRAAIPTDILIQDLYLGGHEGGERPFSSENIYGIRPIVDNEGEHTLFPRDCNTEYRNSIVLEKGKKPWWRFRPFNSIDILKDDIAKRFIAEVKKIPFLLDDMNHLNVSMVLEKETRKTLKKIYKESLKGADENNYTLVVESEPYDKSTNEINNLSVGCVYFGDFCPTEERWKRFKDTIDDYDYIGSVQIPHHGSRENWCDYMMPQEADNFIISSGRNNSHHHPSYWVVRDLQYSGKSVNVVCEESSSMVSSTISFDGEKWRKH